MSDQVSYRPDIDGLRAIAVLAVLGFHAFPDVVRGGFVGVDIFFVISGFLITHSILRDLNDDRFSFRHFYARRIRRIFPALCVVLLAAFVFGWHALFADEFKTLGKHIFGGGAFVSNILYWRESGYFDVSAEVKPLLHLWSLGIEEQFYILFPLLVFFAWKKRFSLPFCLASAFILSFGLNMLLFVGHPVADFYSPATRFWELLAGALLAVAGQRHENYWLRQQLVAVFCISYFFPKKDKERGIRVFSSLLAALGAALLGLSFLTARGNGFPGFQAVLPVAGSCLLIVAGQQSWLNREFLSRTILVSIGLISFSLYLWHWPIISYMYIIFADPPSTMARVCAVSVSIALATLTYFLVERPLRYGKTARAGKTFFLLALMAVLACAGLYTDKRKGFPERPHMLQYQTIQQALEILPTRNDAGRQYAPSAPKDDRTHCRYNDAGGTTTVAVFGDSHALAGFSGIEQVSERAGVNAFLLGCDASRMPIFGILMNRDHENYKRTVAMLATINGKQDIKKVFIFVRGPEYLHDETHEAFKELLAMGVPENLFESALQTVVNAFHAHGKQVYIVADNPRLPQDIRKYLYRPLRTSAAPSIDRKSVLLQQHNYIDALGAILNAIPIWTLDVFCPPEQNCRIVTPGGLPLYADNNHLSKTGSLFLAEEVLNPYLVGETPSSLR
jgi:Predicted acyltransferases